MAGGNPLEETQDRLAGENPGRYDFLSPRTRRILSLAQTAKKRRLKTQQAQDLQAGLASTKNAPDGFRKYGSSPAAAERIMRDAEQGAELTPKTLDEAIEFHGKAWDDLRQSEAQLDLYRQRIETIAPTPENLQSIKDADALIRGGKEDIERRRAALMEAGSKIEGAISGDLAAQQKAIADSSGYWSRFGKGLGVTLSTIGDVLSFPQRVVSGALGYGADAVTGSGTSAGNIVERGKMFNKEAGEALSKSVEESWLGYTPWGLPFKYGPEFWATIGSVSDDVDGAEYLIPSAATAKGLTALQDAASGAQKPEEREGKYRRFASELFFELATDPLSYVGAGAANKGLSALSKLPGLGKLALPEFRLSAKTARGVLESGSASKALGAVPELEQLLGKAGAFNAARDGTIMTALAKAGAKGDEAAQLATKFDEALKTEHAILEALAATDPHRFDETIRSSLKGLEGEGNIAEQLKNLDRAMELGRRAGAQSPVLADTLEGQAKLRQLLTGVEPVLRYGDKFTQALGIKKTAAWLRRVFIGGAPLEDPNWLRYDATRKLAEMTGAADAYAMEDFFRRDVESALNKIPKEVRPKATAAAPRLIEEVPKKGAGNIEDRQLARAVILADIPAEHRSQVLGYASRLENAWQFLRAAENRANLDIPELADNMLEGYFARRWSGPFRQWLAQNPEARSGLRDLRLAQHYTATGQAIPDTNQFAARKLTGKTHGEAEAILREKYKVPENIPIWEREGSQLLSGDFIFAGSAIKRQRDLEAFAEVFGKEADIPPTYAMHGTSQPFNKFDLAARGQNTSGGGAFFTKDPNVAARFARAKESSLSDAERSLSERYGASGADLYARAMSDYDFYLLDDAGGALPKYTKLATAADIAKHPKDVIALLPKGQKPRIIEQHLSGKVLDLFDEKAPPGLIEALENSKNQADARLAQILKAGKTPERQYEYRAFQQSPGLKAWAKTNGYPTVKMPDQVSTSGPWSYYVVDKSALAPEAPAGMVSASDFFKSMNAKMPEGMAGRFFNKSDINQFKAINAFHETPKWREVVNRITSWVSRSVLANPASLSKDIKGQAINAAMTDPNIFKHMPDALAMVKGGADKSRLAPLYARGALRTTFESEIEPSVIKATQEFGGGRLGKAAGAIEESGLTGAALRGIGAGLKKIKAPTFGKAAEKTGKAVGKVGRGLLTARQQSEEVFRAATYLAAKERGLSTADAVNEVFKWWGNFSELSKLEKNVLRGFVLFFSWQLRALGIGAAHILHHPLQTRLAIALTAGNVSGDESFPAWARRQGGTVLGKDSQGNPKFISLGAGTYLEPLGDLLQGEMMQRARTDGLWGGVQGLGQFALRKLPPFMQALPELATNYDSFSQGGITSPRDGRLADHAPASALWLPEPLKKFFGVEPIYRKGTNEISYIKADAKWNWLFNKLAPGVGAAITPLNALADPRKDDWEAIAKAGGFPTYSVREQDIKAKVKTEVRSAQKALTESLPGTGLMLDAFGNIRLDETTELGKAIKAAHERWRIEAGSTGAEPTSYTRFKMGAKYPDQLRLMDLAKRLRDWSEAADERDLRVDKPLNVIRRIEEEEKQRKERDEKRRQARIRAALR